MEKVRVLIAAENILLREEIANLLYMEKNIRVEDVAGSFSELTEKLLQTKANTLFITYNPRGNFSIDELTGLSHTYPSFKILISTTEIKVSELTALLRLPVCGLIMKNCGKKGILQALEALANNEKYLCAKVTNMLIEQVVKNSSTQTKANCKIKKELTERETEITTFIVKGYTNQAIADILYLSKHTVATHRKNIFKKLNVHSVPELLQLV